MNKYFNKILFALFVLSFFIIPYKTSASVLYNSPAGSSELHVSNGGSSTEGQYTWYFPTSATGGNPPSGTTSFFTAGSDLPTILRVKKGPSNVQSCSNIDNNVSIYPTDYDTPYYISGSSDVGDFCDFNIVGFGTGESISNIAILGANSGDIYLIGNTSFGNSSSGLGSSSMYSGGFAFQLCDYLGCDEGFLPEVSSFVTLDLPAESSTVAYNVTFSGTYTNDDTYDGLILWVQDTSTSQIFTHAYSLPLTNGSDLPFSFVYPLSPNREYIYKLRLYDSSDSSYSDWTSEYTFSTSSLATDIPAWEPETCDSIITDFGSCVRNFMRETFYPSPESLSQFQTLTLSNSVPFSYVYDMGNLYYELLDTESTQSMTVGVTTPIGSITFISADMISAIPLAGTIKNILGWLIYMFTAFYIYRLILVRTHS